MAEKKALILLAPAASLDPSASAVEKLLKKAALFNNYSQGEIPGTALEDEQGLELKQEEVAQALEEGRPLMLLNLGQADSAALSAALGKVLEAMDRKTILAVVSKDALALYGQGINAKAGQVERPASAADIIPTLAYVADFPISTQCQGAILYQALKSPNLKLEEINKLKEALTRMEGALARDNREPWDKHDCA